jgi:hypothetical protein
LLVRDLPAVPDRLERSCGVSSPDNLPSGSLGSNSAEPASGHNGELRAPPVQRAQ